MSEAPVRLALVGCGRLAEAGYVPALAVTPGVRLVAVADPERGRRRRVAAAAGDEVRTFPDAASLLDGAAVDGLVLASPAGAHVADAERAAAAGVATLVEKPPAPDAAGAVALAALEPPPWVGFNRRFDPGAAAVRTALRSSLGAGVNRDARRQPTPDGPLELRLEIAYRRRGWGAYTVRDDALTDLGPHLVDWARWIGGADVLGITACELTTERAALDLTLGDPDPDADTATAPLRARLRAATDRPHAELVELRDAAGRVVARHRLGGLVAAVRGRLGATAPAPLVASLAAELAAFAAAARGADVPTLGTARDGHAAMVVIDAARAGAAAGGHRLAKIPGAP